jgi:acyl carrier protein
MSRKQRARVIAERREAILVRLRALLRDELHVPHQEDDIEPDVALFATGLGLDSVDAIELMVCLESEFGVRLADDALAVARMRTVGGLVDLVLASEEVAA